MPSRFADTKPLRMNTFARLGTWYIIALSVVASVMIAGGVLIQNHLANQLSDSHIVNVAGKQRMLSQKITKAILLLQDENPERRAAVLGELDDAITLWKISQDGLLYGNDSLDLPENNSKPVDILFEKVSVPFEKMYAHATFISKQLKQDPMTPFSSFQSDVEVILEQESSFLNGMEQIVLQYDTEAREKVMRLSTLEYILLFASLFVIAMEIIFIFRPTAIQVNETVNNLVASEKNSQRMSDEIRELYASLEKSYEQISQINHPVENPRLFAKSDKGGNVTFISGAFTELSGIDSFRTGTRFSDLFSELDAPNDWMDELVETVSEGNHWKGEMRFHGLSDKEYWVNLIVTPVFNERNEVEELVMMGSNITKRKSAEQKINLKHQAEIDKRINQQKFRSVLILEGQEEERKRIAMDIHDGIGQMLTSLKYHVESIDLGAGEVAKRKLSEIDQLIKLVIKEVRRVTFNLKPTVLGDYGLQAALNVYVTEMSKLIDTRLVYQSTGQVDRMPQKVENNIFRIIQEAINNAIKYSEAEVIEVSLTQEDSEVTVIVKDEGKGFDTDIVEARSTNIESGRGLFNMYERTEYINGRLEIKSEPGKGTVVKLTVPVLTTAYVD